MDHQHYPINGSASSYQWSSIILLCSSIIILHHHYPINGSSLLSYQWSINNIILQWIIINILSIEKHHHPIIIVIISMKNHYLINEVWTSSSSCHVEILSYQWIDIILSMDYHYLTNEESSSLFSFSRTTSREPTYYISLYFTT